MKSKAASSSSLSSSSAVAASLADLQHHHHYPHQQHHSSLGGLFGSAGGQGSAASLLASHPHHLGSYGSGSNNSAAQQIFNYAAAQLNSSNNKNSAHQEESGGGGNWSTENAMALQMSQLFGSNSAAAAAAANPETFAQLNAASQLIAASLIQQRQQQQQDSHNNEPTPPRKSSSKNQNQNNSTFNNNTSNHSNSNANSSLLTCSICGQVSRDPSDYEQHLMTHISLLSANQNAYQYGLNFLRMQNLFNGSSGGGNAATNGTSGAIPGSTVPNGTGSSTIMNKKRKLLAKHQADSLDHDQETMKMKMGNHHHNRSAESDFDSLSRLGLENLLKGTASLDGSGASESHLMVAQQAQSILAQFAQQANKGNGPLGSPTLNATSTSTNSNTAITNSITSGNCTNSTNTSVSTAYPCTNCHKTFATEVDLKAHLIRHLTQHPFVCVSCGKGFKYEHSLNFHIKSYHSGNATGSNGTDGSTNGGKKGGSGKASDSESGPPLKLKKNRNSAAAREAAALEFDELDELPEPKNCGANSLKLGSPNPSLTIPTSGASSSLLHSRLTLMDENHNAMATATAASGSSALSLLCSPGGSSVGASGGTGSSGKFNSELPFFFGKPPTNLPPDSPIQIRSEKLLISILDAVNVATDQSLIFYKCCLCCVAFASLDQMSIHIQNVHLPPGAAASCGAAELFTNSGAQLFGNAKEVLGSGGSSGNQQFSCDKCTAKFTASPEYEMHMQLHRTLEAQAMAPGSGGQTSAAALQQQYPFNLLSHLHPGVNIPGANYPGASTNPSNQNSVNQATVDFRQILANASKDTDFGRKFAAQLLQESTKDHLASLDPFHHHHGAVQQHLHHRNSAKSLFHDSFDRCSPPSTPANAHSKLSPGSGGTGSSDPNNNSLLYLSLLPEHAKSQTNSESTSNRNSRFKVDSTTTSSILNLSHESKVTPSSTPEKVARKPRNTNASSDSSGKSSGSNSSNNGSALRHIKEPVDIFEGAGQSLPIQKFPIGDIEETAPGQFKCRFCDKTFDRVFSVHRHERVHTGFKPCICKTCGRGFSEKRNLRHHIIRFHSDGSGRELLKRKRKPKTGGMFNGNHSELSGESMLLRNESIMSSLLTGNGVPSSGGSGSRRGSRNGNSSVPESLFNAFRQSSAAQAVAQASALNGGGGSLSNLKLSLAEMDQLKGHFGGRDDGLLGSAMNLSNGSNNRPTSGSSSSSRRRKSKPSRKVYDEEEEDDDDEDEDHNEHHHHHNQKKEMLVVDVDVVPLVTEEDEDDDEDEDELDDDEDEEVDDVDEDDDEEEVMVKQEADHHLQDKYRKDIKQQNHSDSDDGDETEEETINGDAPDDKSPLNGTFKSEDLSELPETVQNLNSTNEDHNESKDQRSSIKSEPESEFDESESNDAIPSTKKMPKKVNNNSRKLSLKRKSK